MKTVLFLAMSLSLSACQMGMNVGISNEPKAKALVQLYDQVYSNLLSELNPRPDFKIWKKDPQYVGSWRDQNTRMINYIQTQTRTEQDNRSLLTVAKTVYGEDVKLNPLALGFTWGEAERIQRTLFDAGERKLAPIICGTGFSQRTGRLIINVYNSEDVRPILETLENIDVDKTLIDFSNDKLAL
ncbi:hypothetical protein [Deinococcus sp. QL22]|uniref:hypothetical protein n=1 Tax=Deinococcus sp. QL22 TaxID=2939437 RepID=UPI0020170C72|nr:hypothetical protein [Deinococcus sp. QL22]UQN10633.1 hypothetical protein M1R55_31035 [Deinococcus sp. QL22]